MSKPLNISNQNPQSEQSQQRSQQDQSQQRQQQAQTSGKSNISQEFQNFLADAERLFNSLTSLSGNELEVAKAEFSQRLASAKDTLATAKTSIDEFRTNLAQQTREKFAVTDAYVHDQPWKAVGAGTAIGMVIGLLLARR